MTSDASQPAPSAVISDDKLTAQLLIPPGYDRAMLTENLLESIIRDAGVEVTDYTKQALANLVQDPPPQDQAATVDIACGQPVVNGTDGKLQWLVDQDDPEQDAPAQDAQNTSYYDHSSFVMVHTGDEIGRVHPPTPGQDGRDVTGGTISAKDGKDVTILIDESIMRRADGLLIAQDDGVLHRETGKAQVRKKIEIQEYVDFSTGNIEFDGDIEVCRGVRDCFVVNASGNIKVLGLIEAAIIEAGNDLIAAGGFAGRERGHAKIGGSLRGKYLDNVQGNVEENLVIDREVINCELTINGSIDSPHGSIIGGRITSTGAVSIGTLGSGAGVVTELVIGSVPKLQPFASELEVMVETFTTEVDKLTAEQDLINKMSVKGRMTATDRERQTEIMFDLSMASARLDKALRTLDSVRKEISKRRRVDISVHRKINPGTTFILDDRCFKITEELKGPARIFFDDRGNPVCRQGESQACPLAQITEVKAIIPEKKAA